MSNQDRKTRIRAHMAAHRVGYAQAAREVRSSPQSGLLVALGGLKVGDRFCIEPSSHSKRAWTVGARSARFLVAWRSTPFVSDSRQYTMIDTAFEDSWRGQGPGVVRSSLDTLGGGWQVGPDGAGCEDALRAIETGVQQLSYRRLLAVESISPVRPR